MEPRFKDKTAIITGATSGIGAEIALAFAKAGASLCLTGRNAERGERLLRDCTELGAGAVFLPGDVTQSSFADELVEKTCSRFGGVDVLVNSAGVLHIGTAEATKDQDWRESLAVNLDAPFFMSRAVVPKMRENGGGAIVNIAGDWGIKAAPQVVAYCASKGGLVQLTRAMAIDHARQGIRINAVCPGDVDTEMLNELSEIEDVEPSQLRAARMEASRNGRLATTEDVANAVLFLASNLSSHITGAMIPVDGGSLAG